MAEEEAERQLREVRGPREAEAVHEHRVPVEVGADEARHLRAIFPIGAREPSEMPAYFYRYKHKYKNKHERKHT